MITDIYPGPNQEVLTEAFTMSARGPADATGAKFLIGNGRVPIAGTYNSSTGKWEAPLNTAVPLNGATGGQEPRSVWNFAAVLTVVFEGPNPETSTPHWFFVMKKAHTPVTNFKWREALRFDPPPYDQGLTAFQNWYKNNGSGLYGKSMITLIDDPVVAGRKVSRYRLDPTANLSDQPNTSGIRVQGQTKRNIVDGDEFYVGLSVFFPEDFPVIDDQPKHVNLFQIFGPDSWGTGSLGEPVDPTRTDKTYNGFGSPFVIAAEPLRRADGTYYDIDRVRTGGNSQNPGLPVPIISKPIVRGQWLYIVFHIRVSSDPRLGFIRAWTNEGDVMVPVVYPVAYPGTNDHTKIPFVMVTPYHGAQRSDDQAYMNRNASILPLSVLTHGHAQGETFSDVSQLLEKEIVMGWTELSRLGTDNRGMPLGAMAVLSAEEVDDKVAEGLAGSGFYTKPATGIPAEALSAGVQQSISDAGTASQNALTTANSAFGAAADASAASAASAFVPLSVMPLLGLGDAVTSAAAARAAYEDSATFTETWVDLSKWSVSDLAVSGGYAGYSGTGTRYYATHAFPLGSTGVGRIRGTLEVPAAAGGSTASYVQIGVVGGDVPAAAEGGAAYTDTAYAYALGIRPSSNQVALLTGTSIGGTGTVASGINLPAGTYEISIVIDENWVSINIINSTHTTFETGGRIARSVIGPINNILVRSSDARALSGIKLGSLQSRNAIASFTPRLKETTLWAQYTIPPGQTTSRGRVMLPPSYDSRKPLPVVICPHGRGGDVFSQSSPGQAPVAAAFWDKINAAGFIVVHSDGFSTTEYGNDPALLAYRDIYRHVRDHYATSTVIVAGTSMGGLAALRLITDGVIPASGFYGMAPVVSLRAQYDAGGGRDTEIRAAYGIASDGGDYATKTAGRDPALLPANRFRGLPYLIRTAAADSTVSPATNADVLAAKLAGKAREFVIETVPGSTHLADAVYDETTVIPFLKRATRS